jgi:hypothetical protein
MNDSVNKKKPKELEPALLKIIFTRKIGTTREIPKIVKMHHGDDCYVVNDRMQIHKIKYEDFLQSNDIFVAKFSTEEGAKQYLNRKSIESQIELLGGSCLNKPPKDKTISYYENDGSIVILRENDSNSLSKKITDFWFKNRDDALNAIKVIGSEKLLSYYSQNSKPPVFAEVYDADIHVDNSYWQDNQESEIFAEQHENQSYINGKPQKLVFYKGK